MSENKSDDKKSKETKQKSTRKQIIKVKTLKNTNDMTGAVPAWVKRTGCHGQCHVVKSLVSNTTLRHSKQLRRGIVDEKET